MTNKFLLYADDVVENLPGICRPTVFPGTFAAGGGYTPFFAVNAPPGYSIGALYVESTASVIATATCASSAGTDTLDLMMAGYNVADAPNADARCRTVDRIGSEEVERLLVAPASGGSTTFFKYPRSGASNAATGTTTYVGQWVIPCGEPTDAVQVQIKTPGVSTVFSSGVTNINISYVVYVIPSVNPATVAFVESPLPPYGASSVVPIEQYQPTNISPDLIDFPGLGPSTFQQIQAYNTQGLEVVNMLDSTAINAAQYGYPGVCFSTASTFLNLKGNRLSRLAALLGASNTLTALWIQLAGQPTAGPVEGHDTTPSPPATQKVGASVSGTVASVPARGGTSVAKIAKTGGS